MLILVLNSCCKITDCCIGVSEITHDIFRVRDIAPLVRKAIQIAQSGTPGPVFVEFPIDTLYPYHLVKSEAGVKVSAPDLWLFFFHFSSYILFYFFHKILHENCHKNDKFFLFDINDYNCIIRCKNDPY